MSEVNVTTDFSKLYVTCDSFSDRDMVGLVPGAKWREAHGHWELNLTWSSAKVLRSVFGEELFLDDAVIEWATQELKNRITPCMELRDMLYPEEVPYKLDARLYAYQIVGAQFLATAHHAILSDPVGAGKTATAISAARLLNALPALVVAPKSTLISWKREVENWWPGTPVYVINGDRKTRAKKILEAGEARGICILNWEAARLHSRLAPYGSTRLRSCSNCVRTSDQPWEKCERCPKELNAVDWKLVILDEAHRSSSPKAKSTRACWAVGHMPSVEYRWGLTGTPLTNKLDTLWSILHFLDPQEWPSKVAFISRYCLTRIVPWGSGSEVIGLNPHNEEEFQEIFQPRFRRMPKEIILPQLPPIIRTRRYLQMSEPQARAYNQMREEMFAETESGELLIAANPAVKMLRMVQFSSATVDMIPSTQAVNLTDPDIDLVARLTDPSNKLDALMDDLPDLIEAGESVVVFAVSRQLIEMAEKRLTKAKIPHSVIKGNQKQDFRQGQIDDFQDGTVPVILVVIAAGGVGVNLQRGRIGIFLQRSWSFVENHQGEGRLHRIGSEVHDSIEYIDYISQGTVDEVVVAVAEGKEITLERIVRDRETVQRLLDGTLEV